MSVLSPEQKSQVVELATANLKEGAQLEAEAFENGNPVFVVTEDGEKMPLPSGEYEMEDGTILVVDEDSQIAEVKTKSEEEEVETKDHDEEMSNEEKAPVTNEQENVEQVAPAQEVEAAEDEKMTSEKVQAMIDEAMGKVKEELAKEIEEKMGGHNDDEKEKMSQTKRLKANPDKKVDLGKFFPKNQQLSTRERAMQIINRNK